MAVYLSPVGLSTAQVPNRVSLLATYKERLCRRICENSTNQPEAFVTYKTGTPIFNGTTVFVPVIATVTIVTPGCGCQATTQVIVEEFMAAFQEQTGLPTNVVLSAEGQTQRLANVSCGSSNCLAIYSSLTVTITPAAASGIVSSIGNEPEDWQDRDGSRCYYRGQWKNGNLCYS